MILRNGRGRVRCFDDDCREWAVGWHRQPTEWSVSARVALCAVHLSVATGHGRDAILIDLDERNYDLALERVGPFILQRGTL